MMEYEDRLALVSCLYSIIEVNEFNTDSCTQESIYKSIARIIKLFSVTMEELISAGMPTGDTDMLRQKK